METVRKSCKVFELGHFPKKKNKYHPNGFSFTKEDYDRSKRLFKPCPISMEHAECPLDGALGFLMDYRLAENGKDIIGDLEIPKALADLFKLTPSKSTGISLEFDNVLKYPAGCTLTTDPHIFGAVATAFSNMMGIGPEDEWKDAEGNVQFSEKKKKFQTWHGQAALQQIHDVAAKHGATCKDDSKTDMSSKSEIDGFGQIHDIAVDKGAKCSNYSSPLYYSDVVPLQEIEMEDKTAFSNFKKQFLQLLGFSVKTDDKGEILTIVNSDGDVKDPVVDSSTSNFKNDPEFISMSNELKAIRAERERDAITAKKKEENDNVLRIEKYIADGYFPPAKKEEAIKARFSNKDLFDKNMEFVTPMMNFSGSNYDSYYKGVSPEQYEAAIKNIPNGQGNVTTREQRIQEVTKDLLNLPEFRM